MIFRVTGYFKGIWLPIAFIFVFSCTMGESGEGLKSLSHTQKFADYWYQGQAELTRYHLEQARYGEIHQGNAVLIFVTEDFLPDTQVKYEHGPKPDDIETVLKLNFTRKFVTGIYPYSMMSSVFTPVDLSPQHTLKVSSSSQEWCGHTYVQINSNDQQYEGLIHSYFQAEADQHFSLRKSLLEDEIWTRIRLNPGQLPTGEIELIPALQYLRLMHQEMRAQKANAQINTRFDRNLSKDSLKVYKIEYTDIPRILEITFEADFPYKIVSWEEKYKSGFANPKWLTTRAIKIHEIKTDYWNKNSVADSTYRKQLGF